MSYFFTDKVTNTSGKLIDWATVCEKVTNPPVMAGVSFSTAKAKSACIGAHDLPTSKRKDDVLAHDSFTMLRIDLDGNAPELDEVISTLKQIKVSRFLVYATASHQQVNESTGEYFGNRWRVFIPLKNPLNFKEWEAVQKGFGYHFTADTCANGSQQIMYLPTRYDGDQYRYHIEDGDFISNDTLSQLKSDGERKAQQDKAKDNANQRKGKEALITGQRSQIEAFNERTPWGEVLTRHTAHTNERTGETRYLYENSSVDPKTSKAGGMLLTSTKGDIRYYTHSTTEQNELGLSKEHSYDKFDLFMACEHGGNFTQAFNAIKETAAGKAITAFNQAVYHKSKENEPKEEAPIFTLDRFVLSAERIEERMQEMEDDVFILGGMAALQQMTTFFAKPNTGKTLITLKLIIDDVEAGRVAGEDVYYINADDGGSGAMRKAAELANHGIKAITIGEQDFRPPMLTQALSGMVKTETAAGKVVIVDTYKKFANQMDKTVLSEFNTCLREFTVAGGAVILLAHTNKNRNSDGQLVAAGTSDAVDDTDASYLIDVVNEEKTEVGTRRTVLFENNKKRGDNEMSASYSYEDVKGQGYTALMQSVALVDADVARRKKEEQVRADRLKDKKDKAYDDAITIFEVLSSMDKPLKGELQKEVQRIEGLSRRKFLNAFDLYSGDWWITRATGDKASKHVVPLKGLEQAQNDPDIVSLFPVMV